MMTETLLAAEDYASGSIALNVDAYPDGIPPAIQFWTDDHRVPFPADKGILFEK